MPVSGPEEPSETIRLKDGRQLAYQEVGVRGGPVVVHCHGSGSSRLEALLFAEAANELGVRVITPDRPGMGRSEAWAYPNVLAWADDVLELSERLEVFHNFFGGKVVFLWASVVQSRGGCLKVPYLFEYGGWVVEDWRWLHDGWDGLSPAARFASDTPAAHKSSWIYPP